MLIVLRRVAFIGLLVALPSVVSAGGLNRNYLVRVYAPCETASNCSPPTLASAYTFESAVLYSSTQRYTAADKLSLVVVVKGVKDPSGAPFTGRLQLTTGSNRVTILTPGIGTFEDGSALANQPIPPVEVKNGSGRLRYRTPSSTPDNGLVVNTLTAPVLYDPDGKPLASTGAQTKP